MVASGCSYASEFFVPRILRGGDGYPMAHAYKDLVGAAGLSAERCIPVLAAATATYQAALLGVQVRSRPAPAAGAAA